MLTASGLVFDVADLTAGANTTLNQNGTPLTVGRGQLSRNSQFVAIVQKADANRALTLTLQLTLDGTNYTYQIAQIVVPANFKGQWTAAVSVPDFVWEAYTSDNIKIRVNASAPTNASASDWDKVQCYVTEGEATIAGRRATADTIQV